GLLLLKTERCAHIVALAPRPTVRDPVAPLPIATVPDECGELARRNRPAIEPERQQLDLVRWPLVVVGARRVLRADGEAPARELESIRGPDSEDRRHAVQPFLAERGDHLDVLRMLQLVLRDVLQEEGLWQAEDAGDATGPQSGADPLEHVV